MTRMRPPQRSQVVTSGIAASKKPHSDRPCPTFLLADVVNQPTGSNGAGAPAAQTGEQVGVHVDVAQDEEQAYAAAQQRAQEAG